MKSRPSLSRSQQQRQGEMFDQPRKYHGGSHTQPVLVSPLLHPDKALRRQMLVSRLFKEVKEIRSLDTGYGLRFDRSDDLTDLIATIADYIVFESLNSPQLRFVIVDEPPAKAFWLQVRGLEPDQHDGTSLSILPNSALPYFA